MTTNLLAGKVALVTGAGKGIGLAISRYLADQGCHLMLNARTLSDLQALKQTLGPNVPVEIMAGDMGNSQFVETLVQETLSRLGRVDILINNAGVSPAFTLLQEVSVEEIEATLSINLKGPMLTMKFAIPHMVHQGGGTIINLNSIAGKVEFAYSSVYCASKFGLKALTEAVALEQRQNNIKIVGIYPGEVDTPIWQSIEPGVTQNPALMLSVEDIVNAVAYILNQSANSFVKDITLIPLHAPTHA